MIKYSNNIPKSLSYLKTNIQNSFDNAIRLVKYYIVNANETPRIKIKYLKDLVVEISMFDYYLECLYSFKVLGKNRFNNYATTIENTTLSFPMKPLNKTITKYVVTPNSSKKTLQQE